jgi:hypothetical protein
LKTEDCRFAVFYLFNFDLAAKGRKKHKYALHKVIKPPALGSNMMLQFEKKNLQPWKYYFSRRIN